MVTMYRAAQCLPDAPAALRGSSTQEDHTASPVADRFDRQLAASGVWPIVNSYLGGQNDEADSEAG